MRKAPAERTQCDNADLGHVMIEEPSKQYSWRKIRSQRNSLSKNVKSQTASKKMRPINESHKSMIKPSSAFNLPQIHIGLPVPIIHKR